MHMKQESASKPRRMRGDERRALILARSKRAFAQYGYAEASTAELARASEVTEPMLYKHFGSKKQLFLAVVDDVSRQFKERFFEAVEHRAQDDLLVALSSLLLDYRAAAMADQDSNTILGLVTVDATDPEIVDVAKEFTRVTYAFVHDLLQAAQDKKLLSEHLDLSAAAWGTMSFFYAMQYRKKLGLLEQFNQQTLAEINRLWLQTLQIG
jgi:TetR/AcrR family transcriptional regulator